MDIIVWIPIVLIVATIAIPIYIWLDWEYGITRFLLNRQREKVELVDKNIGDEMGSEDPPIAERPTEFMENVKKAHRSLQLWGERETLQLVEYTESLEAKLDRVQELAVDIALERAP